MESNTTSILEIENLSTAFLFSGKPVAVTKDVSFFVKRGEILGIVGESGSGKSVTAKIMTNPEWTMAGIFADEGITGTSTKKRDDFNRMIRRCKAKKIDLILTKSISRFARNTLDTINYTRMLRAMGIGVIFEKENINTLDMDSEMLITMLGAFAQAESESISRNVAWGKRQAIREGKVHVNFKRLYGYVLREDGIPDIDSEKANVVRLIFERYVAGDSLRMITYRLNNAGILNPSGEPEWKSATIRSILMNEKYCGDVLGQKTFKEGVIGGKVQKNTGQLPQVLIQNNHSAIISRELFYAVQEETKRRTAAKSPSTKSPTGRSSYTSKYALSERLVCGECGTLYRRCTWNGKEQKRIVWRCVSRLDYGKKYCHNSPTMDEVPLQKTIMAALNTKMPPKLDVVTQITDALLQEAVPSRGSAMTLGEVKRRIEELTAEFDQLLELNACGNKADRRFAEIAKEMAELKRQQERIAAQLRNNQEAQERAHTIVAALDQEDHHLNEWDEEMIRQLVHTVKVISADHIRVYLNDGTEIDQTVGP